MDQARSSYAIAQPITGRAIANALPWITNGALAVMDQALFAGGNFAVNILLARWLSPAEYGAFSLAYSVFLLFGALHSALLIEPMMVFGAGKYAARFQKYLRSLLYGHMLVMAPVSLILLSTGIILGRIYSATVEQAFLGLVAGSTFILFQWLVRRAFYVRLQPAWATVGGAVYLVAVLTSLYALRASDRLSTFTAFLAMAMASLLSSVLLLVRLSPGWTKSEISPSFTTVAADHWRYGRWSMASAAVSWFPLNVYYAVLPAWLGLEAAGALRALMNLAMPVLQTIAALSNVLLPLLVRDRERGGTEKMARTMRLFLTLFLSGATLYLCLLWAFRSQVFDLFYGGKYAQYNSWPLILAGLLPFGSCATAVLGSALRAMERPDSMFWCYLGSGIFTIVIGIPMASAMGVGGALAGLSLSSLVSILMMIRFYRRRLA